jgi:hypothetical protein
MLLSNKVALITGSGRDIGPLANRRRDMRYFTCLFFALYICASALHATEPQNGQQLNTSEKQQAGKQGTQNPEAYELYLKGRSYWAKQTRADLETAVSYFNQAIAKDPGYATAYAGLDDAYAVLPDYGASPSEDIPKAKAAALKALELDPTLARAHVNLGGIKMAHKWDFAGGEAEFKKALELDPNDAHAHQRYADNLGALVAGSRKPLLKSIAPISLIHCHQPSALTSKPFIRTRRRSWIFVGSKSENGPQFKGTPPRPGRISCIWAASIPKF